MKRAEFNEALRRKLDGIAEADRKNILDYYNECIDDRMDEGASEEEAIAALGSVDELAAAVLADTPVTGLIPRVIPKRERSDSAPQADAQVIGQDFRSVDAELRSCDLRLAPSTGAAASSTTAARASARRRCACSATGWFCVLSRGPCGGPTGSPAGSRTAACVW